MSLESLSQWVPKTRNFCPSKISTQSLRRLMGGKNRLKAERARFLSKRERRVKPETEPLSPRWGKRCVFLNPEAGAYGFLTHCLSFFCREERMENGVKNLSGSETIYEYLWSMIPKEW